MSNMQQSFSAGQTQGQTQANVEDWMQSGQNTGNAARDRTASAAQSAGDSAKQGTDQASGFLQQTGEQVKNMAQGAVDAVKNTLGTGDSNTTNPTTNRKS